MSAAAGAQGPAQDEASTAAVPGPGGDEWPVPVSDEVIEQTITNVVFLNADGATGGHFARFRWSGREPMMVVMSLGPGLLPDWRFAREMVLEDGGLGDVEVRRLPRAVVFVLDSPSGHTEVHVPAAEFAGFVERLCSAGPTALPFGGPDDGWIEECKRFGIGGRRS